MFDRGPSYLELLSDTDLELMAEATASRGLDREAIRQKPELVEACLAERALFETLFGDAARVEIGVTPFLVFAVLVNRAAADLEEADHFPEWVGAGQRLPVFDSATLSDLLSDEITRFYLIEFLTSFTSVASGSVWVATRRGYRRKRWSELDPVSMSEMVASLPVDARAPGYRRLGEVALFLSGVFPDHTTSHPLGEPGRFRLAHSAGIDIDDLEDDTEMRFYEAAGSGWYQRAVELDVTGIADHLAAMSANFSNARRFLNYLTDRYLHHYETGLMHPAA